MKVKIYICFLFLTCVSCTSSRIATIDSGCFQRVNGNITRTIVLNNDYQFKYVVSHGVINIECVGKWEYISKNTILLQCADEPFDRIITRGYMPIRSHEIKVLNINKLKLLTDTSMKYKYFIFKRTDSLHKK